MMSEEVGISFDELPKKLQELLSRVQENGGHIMPYSDSTAFVVFPDAGVVAVVSHFVVPERFGITYPVFSASVHSQEDVINSGMEDNWADDTVRERLLGRTADEIVDFLKRYGMDFDDIFRPKRKVQWSL